MRWFVSNAGVTVGPIEAAQLQKGIADGEITRGMHVRDEASAAWIPIEQSPFAPLLSAPTQAATRAQNSGRWGGVVLLVSLVGFLAYSVHSCNDKKDHGEIALKVAQERAQKDREAAKERAQGETARLDRMRAESEAALGQVREFVKWAEAALDDAPKGFPKESECYPQGDPDAGWCHGSDEQGRGYRWGEKDPRIARVENVSVHYKPDFLPTCQQVGNAYSEVRHYRSGEHVSRVCVTPKRRWLLMHKSKGSTLAMHLDSHLTLTPEIKRAYQSEGRTLPKGLYNPPPRQQTSELHFLEASARPELELWLFPTLSSAKEFDEAILVQDAGRVNETIRKHAGFSVPGGTECQLLKIEDDFALVRVPAASSGGWLPWAQVHRRNKATDN